MDRLIEFSMNHPFLVGAFLSLLTLLLMLENRRSGQAISPRTLGLLVNRSEATVLDVRDGKDFRDGHITGSVNIPYSQLTEKLSELDGAKGKPVIVVCKMGQHAGAAGRLLTRAGFADVRRLSGGIMTWKAEGLPLVKKSA
jgi:rhodanese-related sulfurtransferase